MSSVPDLNPLQRRYNLQTLETTFLLADVGRPKQDPLAHCKSASTGNGSKQLGLLQQLQVQVCDVQRLSNAQRLR